MTSEGASIAASQIQAHRWERREFITGLAALAGAAGLSLYDMRSDAAEPPPETTTIRIVDTGITANNATRAALIKPQCVRWHSSGIRILYRCWQSSTPYDEPRYLSALRKHRSPLLKDLDLDAQSA